MGVSTTRTADGKAADCGRTTVRTSSGILRAERGPRERSCTSRFGRTRWRGKKPEARSQKPEARSQKPEARSQKPEARSQKPEARMGTRRISEFPFWLLASWLLASFLRDQRLDGSPGFLRHFIRVHRLNHRIE